MLKDMRIQNKLYFGFFAIVSIVVALLFSSYKNFASVSEASTLDRHSLQVLRESDGIDGTIPDLQSAFRGFLLTGNERFLQKIAPTEEELKRNIREAKMLTIDNPAQQERLKKIDVIMSGWIKNVMNPLIAKRRELGKSQNAADLISRDPLLTAGFEEINEVRTILTDFTAEENRLLADRSKRAHSLSESMMMLLVGGGVACVIAAALISYVLVRAILKPLGNLTDTVNQIADGNQSARAKILSMDELGKVTQEVNRMAQTIQDSQQREREASDQLSAKVNSLLVVVSKATAGDLTGQITVDGADAIGQLGSGLSSMFDNLRGLLNDIQRAGIQVTTSTTEIAASAKQQEATGVEQAQTTIEVLSTTKEISANTSQLLKTIGEATQVADYTTTATAQAQVNLTRMDETMQHMVSATDSINAKLAALSDKASNINSVLATISKVADQTNILSLNAAIEAEKAGEAGRGFSVVATEIRRLADQTSVATWDIEQMLKEMQSAVSASVMGMDKFSDEIRRSVDEVREVGEQLSAVIDQVRQLPPRFDAVLEGMQSQSVGASQITETMMQLSDASQQTVESLKATSDAVQQLQFAARDLQNSVLIFSVNS